MTLDALNVQFNFFPGIKKNCRWIARWFRRFFTRLVHRWLFSAGAHSPSFHPGFLQATSTRVLEVGKRSKSWLSSQCRSSWLVAAAGKMTHSSSTWNGLWCYLINALLEGPSWTPQVSTAHLPRWITWHPRSYLPWSPSVRLAVW